MLISLLSSFSLCLLLPWLTWKTVSKREREKSEHEKRIKPCYCKYYTFLFQKKLWNQSIYVTRRHCMCLVDWLKLWAIPATWFFSKQRWSLPLWFWVWETQGDKTPSYYTGNSKVLNADTEVNLGHILLVKTNNEHFPVGLYSCSLRGTELAETKGLLPSQAGWA